MTTVSGMHVSQQHYRPVVTGGAASVLGGAKHLRLVSIAIGAMRDECDACADDTVDALALEPEGVAAVHRIASLLLGVPSAAPDTPEADQIVERIGAFPFPMRTQMVRHGLEQLRWFLDEQPRPEGWV